MQVYDLIMEVILLDIKNIFIFCKKVFCKNNKYDNVVLHYVMWVKD